MITVGVRISAAKPRRFLTIPQSLHQVLDVKIVQRICHLYWESDLSIVGVKTGYCHVPDHINLTRSGHDVIVEDRHCFRKSQRWILSEQCLNQSQGRQV